MSETPIQQDTPKLKAYYLTIKDDDEGVVDVVFARTGKEAGEI